MSETFSDMCCVSCDCGSGAERLTSESCVQVGLEAELAESLR